MKNLFITLAIFALTAGLSLSGQTDRSNSNGSGNQSDVSNTDTKSRFINNQDYLSASSLKDYRNYYGDSLKGFDEVGAKIDILNRHFYGQEYQVVMNYTKRDFIDKK